MRAFAKAPQPAFPGSLCEGNPSFFDQRPKADLSSHCTPQSKLEASVETTFLLQTMPRGTPHSIPSTDGSSKGPELQRRPGSPWHGGIRDAKRVEELEVSASTEGLSLGHVMNSLSLGHVPKPFKLAVIKPLIKKPKLDPCELANCRPISNLPFMSIFFENVVSAQLCSFLQTNDIYEEFQSGFRPRHSTETALVKITNDLLLASDQGCISLLVLLDLSAAFDTIDHDILIDRLQNYTGIQGQALRWFRSYLSDRCHFVYLNGESSQLSPVKYGVPQGSVLGPRLFSIYMLPLGNIIRKYVISFHCYADDTQLYISTIPDKTSKLSKLTECVKNIKDWMTNNFLLLNSDKTEILLIGPKNSTQNLLDYNLQLDGCTVTSSTVKNLCVILDSNLSLENNISHVTKTAFFHRRNIAKIWNMLSVSDAEKLVHAFMTSRLDYCNALLGGCPASSMNKQQIVQNAVVRVLTRSRKYDHNTQILQSSALATY